MRALALLIAWILLFAPYSYAQYKVNPCFGRPDGFARDLLSCRHFFACRSGNAQRGQCGNGNFFDAENERCVRPQHARCFRCPAGNQYQLYSVPRACRQFIHCFNGQPTLRACPSGLVYDGRRSVRNCNFSPGHPMCHREEADEVGAPVQRCPMVSGRPVFLPDRQSCSVFHVCSRTADVPIRSECQDNLHFNMRLGACDFPENAQCQHMPPAPPINPGPPIAPSPPISPPIIPPRPPAPPIAPSPPISPPIIPPRPPAPPIGPQPPTQHVTPALPCPFEGGVFVPDRFTCNIYYACAAGGVPHRQTCSNGLHFCYMRRQCDFPANARCWSNENHWFGFVNGTLNVNSNENELEMFSWKLMKN